MTGSVQWAVTQLHVRPCMTSDKNIIQYAGGADKYTYLLLSHVMDHAQALCTKKGT